MVEHPLHLARLRLEVVGRVVGDPGMQTGGGRVFDHDPHLFAFPQRERLGHQPSHAIALASRKQREVAGKDEDETRVIEDGEQHQHRRCDRERDQRRTDRDRPQQPGLRRQIHLPTLWVGRPGAKRDRVGGAKFTSPPCGEVARLAQRVRRVGSYEL